MAFQRFQGSLYNATHTTNGQRAEGQSKVKKLASPAEASKMLRRKTAKGYRGPIS